jgi:hypothetical protein
MEPHVTVREAVKLTGKSESTIKRLLREIVHDPGHADRSLILPPPDEVERRRQAGEPYLWKIDPELLRRRFPQEPPVTGEGNGPGQDGATEQAATQIMDVLRDQLQSKDRQIATLEKQLDRKDQQIENLNERMRESHILMNELQKKLAIAAPRPASAQEIIDAARKGRGGSTPRPKPAVRKKKSVWTRPILPSVFGRRKE